MWPYIIYCYCNNRSKQQVAYRALNLHPRAGPATRQEGMGLAPRLRHACTHLCQFHNSNH